jgi:L-fuconolactonase
MRLDAHQHFWRYVPEHYPWISEALRRLKRDYLPADLQPELSALEFDGTIAVQARQSVSDTEFLLALAREHDFVRGVVGWVDLCSTRCADELERYANDPKLVGVRHIVHDEPDDDFMLRADFRAGLRRLQEHGLTYDLLLFPRHLSRAIQLVDEFPRQPFVLDHIAKPLIRQGHRQPWQRDVTRLAERPNVTCKLSGLVTEADWERWQPSDIRPYLDVVMDAFGPSRLMIGSDWPVCTVAADYARTMGVVISYLEGFSTSEQEAVLGGNAASVYGIL